MPCEPSTGEFKQRLAERRADLNDLLIEAFAVVREASRRVIGQRHYDVQLMGGAALHFGWVAEMKTGEGKTLVSTLPMYLNALSGKGVHLVTVNDYLVKRDSEWMGQIHRWLGLTVGLVVPGDFDADEKRAQYACDITYGTNNELGFDYLRDNMAMSRDRQVQRGHNYCIVDEVDSILIDEARTPLIIAGRVSDAAKLYYQFASVVRGLKRDEHYDVDEEKRTVAPTDEGVEAVEKALGIENMYDEVSTNLVHQFQAALKAKELFKRDKDYVVQHGEVKIVDEFTGRILEGRRWSEGLHQAVEAKEGVKINEENQTLATVTLQNYFRLYDKLAGMTGTAETEASEFASTYNLHVVPIPTNREMIRIDQGDLIYKSEDAKFDALIEDLKERYETGQPVLVGTISVEKSEKLSRALDQNGIPHAVLNAKQHTREAHVVAQAGRLHAITVATNMAGRGVDIKLGGNAEELARVDVIAEGLDPEEGEGETRLEELTAKYEERHQGRGRRRARGGRALRAGHRTPREPPHRQPAARPLGPPGRPGREPLLPVARRRAHAPVRHRRHELGDGQGPARRRAHRGQDGVQGHRAGAEHRRAAQRRDPQERPRVRRGHERAAQGDLQAPRPDPRRRRPARGGHGLPGRGHRLGGHHLLRERLRGGVGPRRPDARAVGLLAGARPPSTRSRRAPAPTRSTSCSMTEAKAYYETREAELGAETMREIERQVMLQIIDQRWREHLYEMDYLQEGINLRAMGQKDPLVEWQREGFEMFGSMMDAIAQDFVKYVMHAEVAVAEQTPAEPELRNVQYSAPSDPSEGDAQHGRRGPGPGRPGGGRGSGRPGRARRAGGEHAGGQVRVGQDGAQRPLPVRVGQEVQAVPRRVTRRSRADASGTCHA